MKNDKKKVTKSDSMEVMIHDEQMKLLKIFLNDFVIDIKIIWTVL